MRPIKLPLMMTLSDLQGHFSCYKPFYIQHLRNVYACRRLTNHTWIIILTIVTQLEDCSRLLALV